MKNELIHFNDYLEDKHLYRRLRPNENSSLEIQTITIPQNSSYFDLEINDCPFCKTALTVSHQIWHTNDAGIIHEDCQFHEMVKECLSCGWWIYSSDFHIDKDLMDQVNGTTEAIRKIGVQKSFDISDKEIPLNILNSAISKNFNLLYNVNPVQFEKFVQGVLKDFYNCEVKHVGKTNDGGIDLLIIDSENPILVQVKRRMNPGNIEKIGVVREFVGAMYISNQKRGAIVTTAKRFSKKSYTTVFDLISTRKFDQFELIDFPRLASIFKNIAKPDEKPWVKHLDKFK